jgi:hypothetical protein
MGKEAWKPMTLDDIRSGSGDGIIQEQSTRIAELEAENDRLRDGLSLIEQGAQFYGWAWCKAQARGHMLNLDFDDFPKTGKAETEPA